ncbi:hypothetical protein [Paenarthrobacter sp. MSM-2-10-13]|uniref:hypothetical protein n=1 Tax=Paenarthrobacter sp. MSM-2-10-13 TaxID=2717318 RepID=UPI001AA1C043|nr:hypothetical protein [Paenarthrobacter sp. MSM-2-10-13]
MLNSSVDDPAKVLASLPILYKDDFRGRPEEFLATGLDKVDKVTTSGSSGEPAVFYLDRRRAASEWAYVCHAWGESGYKPGNWRSVIRGVHLGGRPPRRWKLSRATSELMLSAMGLDEATSAHYWELTKQKRIRFIHGYPSAIAALAKAARADDSNFRLSVQGIFPVSEGTLPHQQALIQTAFPNATFLPSYGLSERVAMARYNPQKDTYSFYPLYGYVELLDDSDRPVAVGERGRIIATGLRLTAMPLLRYDTGDTAELVEVSTGGLEIRDIRGRRAQEHLVTHSGGTVSIAALNLHSAIYEKIFAFRIRQFEAGKAEVLVVPAIGATPEDVQGFGSELQKSCLDLIKFTTSSVVSLPPTPNAKIRLIEQHIPSVVKE